MDFLKKLALLATLLLLQTLVFNHIRLFGVATPLMYLYFVMLFRRNYPRWAILLWSFAMGVMVDILSNTPGLAAMSATLIGFIQPYILSIFLSREAPEDLQPSMKTLGVANFAYYTLLLLLIYTLLLYGIEAFSFVNWAQWISCVAGSTLLTAVLILVVENLRKA
ncbi:MAG: rod shape-determining protein MreD [Prevotella sp.]|nr:rod shape-determining protein MreD [Prevotella sp.]